jgi:hypothetical protein
MSKTAIQGKAAAGPSRLLAISVLYFCSASISIFTVLSTSVLDPIDQWGNMNPMYFTITTTTLIANMICGAIIATLLIVAGRGLERQYIRMAGSIYLISLILNLALIFLDFPIFEAVMDFANETGIDPAVAVSSTSFFTSSLPSASLSIAFAVYIRKDSLQNGLPSVIATIVLVITTVSLCISAIQIVVFLLNMTTNIHGPSMQIVSILWGVYFLIARRSLACTPPVASA